MGGGEGGKEEFKVEDGLASLSLSLPIPLHPEEEQGGGRGMEGRGIKVSGLGAALSKRGEGGA